MSVEVMVCVHGSTDPNFDSPATFDMDVLPAPGDWIRIKVLASEGEHGPIYRHVAIEVRHRQFCLDQDRVQLDCWIVDDGRRPPDLRSI